VKFTGIAVSPGIGIGPIRCLQREEFVVREAPLPPERIEPELLRFREAVEASRQDIARIRDGIAAELGEHEAGIYDAHLMMLDDPELLSAVEHAVRGEHRDPGYAFGRYMASVATRLEAVDDEYLRERRSDVLDVERRVLRHLLGGSRASFKLEQPAVIVAHDLGPSDVALLKRDLVLGLVTEVGGRTSHSAIVARGRGIPAVVNVQGILQKASNSRMGVVDGSAGVVEIDPDPETGTRYRVRRDRFDEETRALREVRAEPAVTSDGRRIDLGCNIELPSDAEGAVDVGADSIGLFRTEFFYLNRLQLPTEEEQYEAYREVAERLAPRPVLFRTMDLGGDKVASYLGTTHETNPFLGWRGIRFALHHPEVFRTQIRAIYRASAHGRVRMLFTMVSSEEELLRAVAMCREVRASLAAAGVPHDPELEIGVMVETPSAVWLADVLARTARFLSIGTNDLTQYTLAMDRDNERLAELYEPLHPAILRSIHHTVEAGHRAGRWVGVCGEMAGDPRVAVLLVGLGVDEMSLAAVDLLRVKAAVRSVSYETAREVARVALEQASAADVRRVLAERVHPLLPEFLAVERPS